MTRSRPLQFSLSFPTIAPSSLTWGLQDYTDYGWMHPKDEWLQPWDED